MMNIKGWQFISNKLYKSFRTNLYRVTILNIALCTNLLYKLGRLKSVCLEITWLFCVKIACPHHEVLRGSSGGTPR